MAKENQYAFDCIQNPKYQFYEKLGLTYLTFSSYNTLINSLSILRRNKDIDFDEYHIISRLFKHYYKNSDIIKRYEDSMPRKIAQKFIGKKNIRNFIFKRDNYKCLKCGSNKSIQIDHIAPIKYANANRVSNLQTLCRSCNIKKSDKFKDYRNGAR